MTSPRRRRVARQSGGRSRAGPVGATARAGEGVDSQRRYARIYAVVRRIPRGKVSTYGEVAALAGLARHARLAGYALHALGDAIGFPWHRVVGAGGRLSLMRKSADAGLTQRIRLENEGIRFDARGRVDLRAFGWRRGRATVAKRKRAVARD